MKQLIQEASELIEDQSESAKLIHHILSEWDADTKIAFMCAWRIKTNK